MRCIILVFTSLLLFFSCKKIERINPVDGIVGIQTLSPRQIDLGTLEVSGNLDYVEDVPVVTQRGVCWSNESMEPTLKDEFITQGSGYGSFSSTVTGLKANTTYFFRAFAANEKRTAYGSMVKFSIRAPFINTKAASNITTTSVNLSGSTISNGFTLIDYGILWGIYPNVTDADTKIVASTKDFTLALNELESGKTYYFRAYANTTQGIAYGEVLSFTTLGTNSPSLTTKGVTNIGSTVGTSGGEITSDGGLPITDKGVCWSTSSYPTKEDNYASVGSGIGNYTVKLTNLLENTTYSVRAYATNAKGTSYGQEVSFTTSSNTNATITDIDGNTYKKVIIGTQTWMAENLKTTKYSDGTTIPNVTDATQWSNLTTGAWSYYNNDAANNAKYGKLYNWYAVSPTTNGNKNICPTGWHVPTDADWTVLTDYLGGASVAGGKMKEAGTISWVSPNTEADNTSLFTGLPGGSRNFDGNYYSIGGVGYWWSSSELSTDGVWIRYLYYGNGGANRNGGYKKDGFSVRCLRD